MTMRKSQKSNSLVKRMLIQKHALSRATITVFMLLVLSAVLCQGQAGDIKVYFDNVTVPLGGEAMFYCETEGEKGQLFFNEIGYIDEGRNFEKGWPEDVDVSFNLSEPVQDEPRRTTIRVTVPAKLEYNNSVLRCSDEGTLMTSRGLLTIQGAPAKPEVSYEITDYGHPKVIELSWPRPFTWVDYDLTEYHVVCSDDTMSIRYYKVINDTSPPNVNVTFSVDIPSCDKLNCTVTAFNKLGSNVSNITIPIPQLVTESPSITIVKPILFTDTKIPLIEFCVKLPELCSFQTINYTIIIIDDSNNIVDKWTTEYSYSSHSNGECIEEIVDENIEEGRVYSVEITVDGGVHGNSSSSTSFKPELQSDGLSSSESDFFQTRTGLIVGIVVGAVLIIVLLALIIIVIMSYRNRGSQSTQNQIVKAPLKRMTTPMVNNPIYDDSHDSPFYEQVQSLHLKRLNSTSSHSNLDSPGPRIPSPTQSTTTPTRPLYNNKATSPVSTTSNNNNTFMWPYSAVQPTNAATFDAIEADVNRVTSTTTNTQSPMTLPSSTPGEESYMTMQSAANHKNVQPNNNNNASGQPRYAIDIHGNRYIEC